MINLWPYYAIFQKLKKIKKNFEKNRKNREYIRLVYCPSKNRRREGGREGEREMEREPHCSIQLRYE